MSVARPTPEPEGEDLAPESPARPRPAPREVAGAGGRRRRSWRLVAAVLLVAGAAGAYLVRTLERGAGPASGGSAPGPPAPRSTQPAVRALHPPPPPPPPPSVAARPARHLRNLPQSPPAQGAEAVMPLQVPEPVMRVAGGVAGGVPGGVSGGVIGEGARYAAPASTGGTAEPNDQPYGDMFFRSTGVNPFVDTDEDRLSTFALDVDSGSYTLTRGYLGGGHLPPPEAIRVEEFVNAFRYGDAEPRNEEDFALTAEAAPTPFAGGERYRLLRFHLQARRLDPADRAPAVLTFVVDVSGSMAREDRLELVKRALDLLVGELRRDDRVGLVVYGDQAEVVLEHTGDHERLRQAIAALEPTGSTNAEAGLALGYDLAGSGLREGAINRIVLCSDGVANVGETGPESILRRIGREARRGIELTTVGFGMGNYNDALMEQLADQGNGHYAYVDHLSEARRVFVEDLTGTLQTIGRDAKAQVEFDPAVVARWRLLGYENRDVADERFRDDSVDAGEIGAGHEVTALYEVKLQPDAADGASLATLRLRYRRPDGRVVETERRLAAHETAASWEEASAGLRLAAVVAELAELLKGSYWAKDGSLRDVAREAAALRAERAGDERIEELAAIAERAARLRERSAAAADDGGE